VDRARLGEHVRRRRVALGLSVARAARQAGINRATWAAVEDNSRETEPYNYGLIERALDWTEGSIEAILDGGEPSLIKAKAADGASMNASRAERAIRKIEEVLDFRGIDNSMRVNTIRGIVYAYRRKEDHPDGVDVAQPDDDDGQQLVAG
jgi:transcriptional regulator with XRE-family HTH domain